MSVFILLLVGGFYLYKSSQEKSEQGLYPDQRSGLILPEPHLEPGEVSEKSYTDPGTEMEFVFIKGGCFAMGCGSWTSDCDEDEKPVHEVCVDDFSIGKYEVTQAQWRDIMGNDPSQFRECGDQCPAETMDWNDVQEFLSRLNKRTDTRYRLPTEAEWEYACRSGGRQEKYAGGNSLTRFAWYGSNSGWKTHPVGQKEPNGVGIYDMNGNVWEWVVDWYDEYYYAESLKTNPQGPHRGTDRIVRGGSWNLKSKLLRCSLRRHRNPSFTSRRLGVRIVKTE